MEGYILKLAFSHDKAFTIYTPRRTKLQFKIIFEEDPVRFLPIASAQQYHIYIIFKYLLYIFLRERSRKVCCKTHQIAQLTRNLGSICSNTPKYSVRSNTLSIIFYIKNEYFYNFFLPNFSQNILQNAPFLKIFSREHAPEPS